MASGTAARRRRLMALTLLAAAVLLGWLIASRVLAPPVVRTVTPTWGPLAAAVYGTGVVEPLEWAKVRAETSGRLVLLARDEGDDVAAGDLLAQIDDPKQRARLAEIDARIRFLEAEIERQRPLVGAGVASRKTWESLQSEFHQVMAQRAVAAEGLRQSRVTAPIAGRIIRREGRAGELVDTGTPLFWIGSPRERRIVVQIDEEYFPQVALGQRAFATADAHPGSAIPGRVVERTPLGDSDQRAFRIRIAPDDPGQAAERLPFGTTVEVNVVVRTVERALLVPRSAIAGAGLWLVRDGRAEYRSVRLGLRGRDRIEVLDGLAGEEEIVLEPTVGLASGMAVRAMREVPTGASGRR